MPPPRHPEAQARLEPLFALLARHGVTYVVTGSVAAKLHGVELEHRDVDIVPETTPENLGRLARVIAEIEGRPAVAGHWEPREDGGKRWITDDASEDAHRDWKPDVADPQSFDHRFRSTLGDFDVVPELTGRYEDLARRAVTRRLGAIEIPVAHVEDLLVALDRAGRPKHVERAKRLRAMPGS